MTNYRSGGDHDVLLMERDIPEYDNKLAVAMILEAKSIAKQIEELAPPIPEQFTIRLLHHEMAYFHVKARLPVIQYTPKEFNILTQLEMYHRRPGKPISPVFYVPCYILNLNHVVLMKRYDVARFESESNTEGIFKQHISEKGTPMTLSSTNILLHENAKEKFLDEQQKDVKKCFEYCYWHLPEDREDVSCMHNLIYHHTNKIVKYGIVRIHKTLVKVLRIENKQYSFQVLKKNDKIQNAEVLILKDDGKKLRCEKKRVYFLKAPATRVSEGDIINALVVSQTIKHPKYTLVIGQAGSPLSPGDIKPLLSLAMWKLLQNIEVGCSPTLVGTTDRLGNYVEEIIRDNGEMFGEIYNWQTNKSPGQWIPDKIDELFPFYMIDGGNVHQLSPTIMSFLVVEDPSVLSDRKKILQIIKLFNEMKIEPAFNVKKHLHFKSDIWEEIQKEQAKVGGTWQKIIFDSAPRIANRIIYSRVFSQHSKLRNF